MIFLLLENLGRLLMEWAQAHREAHDEPVPYIVRRAWSSTPPRLVKEKPSCDVRSV